MVVSYNLSANRTQLCCSCSGVDFTPLRRHLFCTHEPGCRDCVREADVKLCTIVGIHSWSLHVGAANNMLTESSSPFLKIKQNQCVSFGKFLDVSQYNRKDWCEGTVCRLLVQMLIPKAE